jgi:hypothetical protein
MSSVSPIEFSSFQSVSLRLESPTLQLKPPNLKQVISQLEESLLFLQTLRGENSPELEKTIRRVQSAVTDLLVQRDLQTAIEGQRLVAEKQRNRDRVEDAKILAGRMSSPSNVGVTARARSDSSASS